MRALKFHERQGLSPRQPCPSCGSPDTRNQQTLPATFNGIPCTGRRKKCRACGKVWRVAELREDQLEELFLDSITEPFRKEQE